MTTAVDQRSSGVPPIETSLSLEHVFPRHISIIIDVTTNRAGGERPQSSLLGVADRYDWITNRDKV